MITVVMVWLLLVMLGFGLQGLFSSQFFRWGPGEELTYLTLRINTWQRYLWVASFVVVSTAINDLAGDSISPFLGNVVAGIP